MADKENPSPGQAFPKTLSQSIYNYLKNSIIDNELKANQRINEKEIAGIFGVSTTPVREAVLKLGAEGFVTINFHREAVVKETSYEELKEIFEVLGALDSVAAPIAVENLSPEKLKELEDLTKEMERHCSAHSLEKYLDLHVDMHNKIWDSIPNKFLKGLIRQINDQMLRYKHARIHAFQKSGVHKKSLDEHKELIKALKTKDKRRLKTLMPKHWVSPLKSFSFKEGLNEYLSSQ